MGKNARVFFGTPKLTQCYAKQRYVTEKKVMLYRTTRNLLIYKQC
jgi:hypothetical protein